jgi:peroxiredoxin Q/BCP
MKKIIGFITSLLCSIGFLHAAEPLEVGQPAPEVKGIDQDGQEVDLAKAYEKGPVLVYFYPKADTSGCTKQACSLRDEYTALQGKGIQIFGVSGDKPEAQKDFQEKYNLPFTLLADPEGKVMDAFGVPRKGKFAARQAFLIRDGKVVWLDRKASTAKQAADVLEQTKDWPEIAQADDSQDTKETGS